MSFDHDAHIDLSTSYAAEDARQGLRRPRRTFFITAILASLASLGAGIFAVAMIPTRNGPAVQPQQKIAPAKDAAPGAQPGPLAGLWKNMGTKEYLLFQDGTVTAAESISALDAQQHANPKQNVTYRLANDAVTVIYPDKKEITYDISLKNVARTKADILLKVFH